MSCIAIIPARNGSRRIPGKNTRMFRGKPIIQYSIAAAIESALFSRIYVSTDSMSAYAIAHRMGVDALSRPEHLARDSVGTQEVVADALRDVLARHTIPPPCYACCIYATAPLMMPVDLIEGYLQLRTSGAPYVYTVGPDWQDAGQWYWGPVESFLSGAPLDQAALYKLPASRVCDINTEADWKRAEVLYSTMGVS